MSSRAKPRDLAHDNEILRCAQNDSFAVTLAHFSSLWSLKTLIDESDYFEASQYSNRNIAWGIREMGMCASSSGMALHGGIRPYAATFFIFTDYARPAIRLACLMKLPVIYESSK